jgi:hypothetical protein
MITCDLCATTALGVVEAIYADWEPAYFVGNDQRDPICAACFRSKCHVADDGSVELVTPNVIVNAVLA